MLVPNLKRISRSKFSLVGAEIYDRHDNYLGYWYVHNMPSEVKRRLHNHALEWVGGLSEEEKRWYFETEK